MGKLAMLPGYNHNIRYKDETYHIQTEDSGLKNPHINSHIFIGGNIIESVKSSYAHLLEAPDFEPQVQALMQKQHKALMKRLIKGELDGKLEERCVNASKLNGPAPINVEPGQDKASVFLDNTHGNDSAVVHSTGATHGGDEGARSNGEASLTVADKRMSAPKASGSQGPSVSTKRRRSVKTTGSETVETKLEGAAETSEEKLDLVILSYLDDKSS
jgi:hypothetical protein